MELHPIWLGDGRKRAQGWLVVSDGAVRAILTPADQEIYFSFACDRRVRPPDGFMRFRHLGDASAWMSERLEPGRPGTGDGSPFFYDPYPDRL